MVNNHKRKLAFLAAAAVAVSMFSPYGFHRVLADTPIAIIVNGQTLIVDVAPVIVSDRVLVPFRHIGTALGADVGWDDATKKVSMILRDRFLELSIGSEQMNIGRISGTGDVVSSVFVLDSPATIINSRAMVPLRAVSEGLGATVEWNAQTRTVSVIAAAPTPVPTPTPVAQAYKPDFATDANFEIISAGFAQSRYDYNNSTVFYYFDSQDDNAATRMAAIKQAAAKVGTRVEGLDIRTSSNLDSLKWIWNVNQTKVNPMLIFFYAQGQIVTYSAFTTQEAMDTYFYNWAHNIYNTNTPTPTPSASPTPSGSITPTPGASISGLYINPISVSYSQNMYDNNERFILVCYDSSTSTYQDKLNIIQQAVKKLERAVYAIDLYRESDYNYYYNSNYYYNGSFSWFPYQSGFSRIPNPIIFFVDGRSLYSSMYDSQIYNNVDDLERRMNDFLNSGNFYY